jgi:hypothetical protein
MRSGTVLACCGLLLGLLPGCGGSSALPPVEGHVYYRGAPVAGGTLVFTPDPERGGRGNCAVAVIQPDGRYRLRTGNEPGAAPGWHRITVAAAAVEGRPPVQPLPSKYCDPLRSDRWCEVKAGQANVIDIHLD